jgi:1-acyl-sn-glycerol-3-phosphate acyltransferase
VELDQEIGPHSPWYLRFILPVARVMFALVFFVLGPVVVRGKYRVPKTGGVLILSNHLADVDPIVVQMACPRPIHFMAKSELFDMKVLRGLITTAKAFPVKRGEPDRAAIKRAVALIRTGEVVCIFPEGELSESGELLPLKPGIALIARMTGCPVICCGLRNTNRILPYGSLVPRPTLRRTPVEWGDPRQFDKHAETEEIVGWAEGQLRSLTGQER